MRHIFRRAGILSALLALHCVLLFPDGDDFINDEFFFSEEEGITVVGTSQTSQQMTVIDRADIERRCAPDLASLLQQTLNIAIVRYGAYGNQAGITLRGFDSKRVAFLVDGSPVNSSLDGKIDIDRIDLNSIERIEVVYGGSDSKYNVSGAFGGVINIITVKKQKPGLQIGGSISNTAAMPGEYRDRSGGKQDPHWEDLLDTQNYAVSAAYGGGPLSMTANAFYNRAANHFIFSDYVGQTRRKDNNEVWDTGASGNLIWELSDPAKLISSTGVYSGGRNLPISGFSGNTGVQQDFSVRQNFMLEMPRAFRDDLAAEASLAWLFDRRDYTSSSGAFSRHDQNSFAAISRWNWYAAGFLTLRSGADYRFIRIDSTDIGCHIRHDGGVYLTAEYNPAQRFLIVPSIKAVVTSTGSAPVTFIPKLGLLWNPADSLVLKNNYFRSFKLPDFEELYWSGAGGIGNPDLRPEDGWGADIGAAWQITGPIKLESVFFTQWTKDSIHWYSQSGGIWRPENVAEAIFFGLDNKFNFEIPVSMGPVQKIVFALSYQYLLSYLLSYGYTFESNRRVPYNPIHTIGGSLEIPWGTGSLLVSAHYESQRWHDTANLTGLRPFFLLDAALNQKIGKHFSVFAVLRNILNESYESFYAYPMPGITMTLGVRVNVDVKQDE
jgi:vitamin B12 transporter